MYWRNCITLTKLHHPMRRNCIPGDIISSVRTFWFQHSAIYTIFNFKCISAQQIKENTLNFQLNSYVRMKYIACLRIFTEREGMTKLHHPSLLIFSIFFSVARRFSGNPQCYVTQQVTIYCKLLACRYETIDDFMNVRYHFLAICFII